MNKEEEQENYDSAMDSLWESEQDELREKQRVILEAIEKHLKKKLIRVKDVKIDKTGELLEELKKWVNLERV